MKSKEEIEYAAANLANPNACKTTNWIEGYTQCQEDMVKDLEMHIMINEHDWSRNPQAQLRDFINSLNKVD